MEGLDDNKNEERDAAEDVEDKRGEHSPLGSSEFDPEVISEFRKAPDEVSQPQDYKGDGECIKKREIQRFPGIVRARVNAFQQKDEGVSGGAMRRTSGRGATASCGARRALLRGAAGAAACVSGGAVRRTSRRGAVAGVAGLRRAWRAGASG